jgi:hypothetical protein
MDYLITENQLKSILLEEKGSKITNEVESLNDFTKNISYAFVLFFGSFAKKG